MIEEKIVSLISTVGFPIAAYLIMYLDLRKIIKKNSDLITEQSIAIKQLIYEHDQWERGGRR